MRIAVCDDNPIDRGIVCSLLEQVFANDEALAETSLEAYDNGLVLLDEVRDGEWFDVILLDIYMQGHLGIDVAHRLRAIGYDGAIVFLTATSDFAIDGYEVSAAGYIVKPATVERLTEVLGRVNKVMREKSYSVRQRSALKRIPLAEISFIESSNNKCILHRSNGEAYNIYKRLDKSEEELAGDDRFLRCAQSFIVNMDYISQVDKSFYLTTGDIVLIRQRSLKAIQQTYYNYISRKSPGGKK